MGFVTVLVKHNWSLQPSQTNRQLTVSSATATAHQQQSSSSKMTNSKKLTRLTDKASIQMFIKRYNVAASDNERQHLESEIRELLDRLSRLVLLSCLSDPVRQDSIRQSLKSVFNIKAKTKIAGKKFDARQEPSVEKTKVVASQARLSLICYSYCRTKHIKDKAMDILLEALNTNVLAYDSKETELLFDLVDELRLALEHTVDKIKQKDTDRKDSDPRIPIDIHIEKLLQVSLV
jgi:hypothetical protein